MMKLYQANSKLLVVSLLFALFIGVTSCEEIPPLIDFSEPEPIDLTCADKFLLDVSEFSRSNTDFVSNETPEAQCKMVLVEEFSGVRCVNCPAGHEITEELLKDHPDQVAALTIHAGFLSAPYNESKENYVIAEGSFLYDFLQVNAVPAASIDRVQYEGEDFISLINRNVWTGKVNERLSMPPPMNVYTDYAYDATSRTLEVFVRVHYLEAFNTSAVHQLSVSLSESHIIDYQLKPVEGGSIEQPDYEHNHVLRAMMTPSTGMSLDVDKVAGTVVERVLEITLGDTWVAENMEFIVFVHDSETNQILQAAKKYLTVE